MYGVNQSEARFMVTSQQFLSRISAISPEFEHLEQLIYIASKHTALEVKTTTALESLKKQFNVSTMDNLVKLGEQSPKCEFAVPDSSDVTLIMYTRYWRRLKQSKYFFYCTNTHANYIS